MSDRPPLSDDAKAAGHRLYQELYAPISEGVELTVERAQEIISRLTSPSVPASELIRAAMVEANFRYSEASDDEAGQTAESAVSEPSGRMIANSDVVCLLQEAQIQLWDAEPAMHAR